MIKMKDSGIAWIGEIPSDWNIAPNKRVMQKAKIICDKYSNENVLSLTMNGVIVRDLDNPTGKMPLTFDGYQYVQAGNLLMCLFDIDVTPRCIGVINDDGVTSPAYSQFKLLNDNYVRYYYYYYLYLDFTKELLHLAKNLRHSLTESQLGEIYVPVPPLETQHRIADYLDDKCAKIDTIIEKQQAVIEKLKEYKLSVITETVTKGLNPDVEMKDSGNEWIGKIPKHWECNKLKYLFILHRGYDLSSENFKSDKIPVIGSSGFMGFHNAATSSAPNVVIGRSGSTGKLHYVTEDFWAHNTGIYISNLKGNCAKYIYYLLHVVDMNELATKTAVPTLDRKKIQNYILSFTYDVKEQQQIVEYLDKKCITIDSVILKKQDVIIKLTEYKKALIYEVVTGKKEV